MVAILGYSRQQVVAAVRQMYSTVAEAPSTPFHFPVGLSASRALGYPDEHLARLPRPLLESFAGVGYPFRADAIRPGDRVLDIGAGAGNDSLLAGQLTGPNGQVIALDLTEAMTRKLKHWAGASQANVEVVQGSAEQLPLADASVDTITSNGVLNLVPDKPRALAEMARVLKPGGRLQLADVVIQRPVNIDCSDDPRLWVECVVGATVDEDLLARLGDAGFADIRVLRRQDYFAHSPSAQTRDIAASFGAYSLELSARRSSHTPSRLQQWLRRSHPKRWLAALARRGFLGVAGLILALLACYGTLAAVGLLAVLGIGLALNKTVWAAAIAVFALLAAAATAMGARRHRRWLPALVAVAGAGLVCYALFVHYLAAVELAGFVLLAAAVAWDLYLRRRREVDTLLTRQR